MTEQLKEQILEAACGLCHWPFVTTDEAEMDEKCEYCQRKFRPTELQQYIVNGR